jgi:hypothetical protein
MLQADFQADGGVAWRVDLFENNKQKTTKLMKKKIIKHYRLHSKCMGLLGLANFQNTFITY